MLKNYENIEDLNYFAKWYDLKVVPYVGPCSGLVGWENYKKRELPMVEISLYDVIIKLLDDGKQKDEEIKELKSRLDQTWDALSERIARLEDQQITKE